MSLLSTDITKLKRLPLGEVKHSTAAPPLEVYTPVNIDRPPTDEDILYSRLAAINPSLESLVNNLDLVSSTTGERLKKVDFINQAQEVDNFKLMALANKLLKPEEAYTRDEVVSKIKEATNVSQERADKGFTLMLNAGAIQKTTGESYYLKGSTPF